MSKILVFGGHGLLGKPLVSRLESTGFDVVAPKETDVNICSIESLLGCFECNKPDLVINAAAWTDVDKAEQFEAEAFKVNALGAQNIAYLCGDGCMLLHISTDYVFDGVKGKYTEFDPTGVPPNVYGRTKLAAEEFVRQVCKYHIIVRTSALYGAGRPTFPDWVLSQEKPRVITNRFVSPTWTEDLVGQIVILIQKQKTLGVTFHCVGEGGPVSWYDFAYEVLKCRGEEGKLRAIWDKDLPQVAHRGYNTSLRNYMLTMNGLNYMPHWKEGVRDYMKEREVNNEASPTTTLTTPSK